MWRMLIPVLFMAGCAQLPPTPADIQAKRFESVADKSVIYVVRRGMDSREGRGLTLDERMTITTLPKSYYRWEVAPGTHRVAGFGWGGESVTLTTTAGGIYFVQHTVLSEKEEGTVILSALQQVDDRTGRDLVMRAELLQ